MRIQIKPDPGNAKTLKLISEWKQRAKALQNKITYEAAQAAKKDLLGRIPNTSDLIQYRRSMEVVQVEGGPKGQVQYAVRSNPKAQQIKEIPVDTTVIYCTAKRNQRRAPASVLILERFNPWTPDTLPFSPSSKDATLLYRKVRKQEAAKVRALRKRDKSRWSAALQRAGIQAKRQDQQLIQNAQVVQDTVFTAMRLEFGLGAPPKPHWMPMVKWLTDGDGGRKILNNPEIDQSMTELGFTKWKTWDKLTAKKITRVDDESLEGFEKKLLKE